MPPKPQSTKKPVSKPTVTTSAIKGGSGGLGRGRGGSQTSGTKKSAINPPGVPGKKVGSQPPNTKNKIGTTSGSAAVAKQPNGQAKKKVLSKEDQMACKIQTCYRGYRCRKLLLLLRQKKQEYEDTIERLQREAFVQIVRMEQERAAKEREREEEVRRKRREEAARVKQMLEAAFDGDNDEINKLLQEVAKVHSSAGDAIIKRLQYKLIDCTDPNNNTPISEAAAGGHSETIKLLVSLGANPNGKGQYGRTPLYRAAFGGHGEAVKMLLETGADPRIYADDGALPEHVASGSDIELTLQEWNIEETEKKLVLLEDQMRKRREQEEKIWKTQEDKLQIEIKEAEKEHSVKQKELAKAYEELNKRIYEHDKSMNAKPELTLTAIHDAEEHLERCKLQADNAREKLQQAKLKMRMKRKEYQSDLDLEDLEEEVKADVVINIRELDDVLMKDVGDKIAQSNKWPLIIDPSKQCTTFLRYRDTNYLSVVNLKHMEPEIIRMNLLGAIRFGKFLVLDLLDIEDMWPVVVMKFEQVQQNLLPSLLNKGFLKEERYLKLIHEGDGELYSATQFLSARIGNFKLVILTQLPNPPLEIKEYMYIIRIHIPEPNVL